LELWYLDFGLSPLVFGSLVFGNYSSEPKTKIKDQRSNTKVPRPISLYHNFISTFLGLCRFAGVG